MSKIPLKPHVYRELVNNIRDVTSKPTTISDRIKIFDLLSDASSNYDFIPERSLAEITLELSAILDRHSSSQSKRARIGMVMRKYFESSNEPE